jgi:hypothetical protein
LCSTAGKTFWFWMQASSGVVRQYVEVILRMRTLFLQIARFPNQLQTCCGVPESNWWSQTSVLRL